MNSKNSQLIDHKSYYWSERVSEQNHSKQATVMWFNFHPTITTQQLIIIELQSRFTKGWVHFVYGQF